MLPLPKIVDLMLIYPNVNPKIIDNIKDMLLTDMFNTIFLSLNKKYKNKQIMTNGKMKFSRFIIGHHIRSYFQNFIYLQ